MKILVKDNNMFGGYITQLVNDDLSPFYLPDLNTWSPRYANKSISKAVNSCLLDAKILGEENVEVIKILKEER